MVTPFPKETFTIKGDAEAIKDLGRSYQMLAFFMEMTHGNLGKAADPNWTGSESDTYRQIIKQLQGEILKSAPAYAAAGLALVTFGDDVDTAQKAMVGLRDDGLKNHKAWEDAERLENDFTNSPLSKIPILGDEGKKALHNSTTSAESEFRAVERKAVAQHNNLAMDEAECAATIRGWNRSKHPDLTHRPGQNGPIATDPNAIRTQAMEGQQGGINDCWLITSLISYGAQHPEDIAQRMQWDPNLENPETRTKGGYRVTIYDGTGKDASGKDILTPREFVVYPDGLDPRHAHAPDGSANWIAIYEDAYRQLKQSKGEEFNAGAPSSVGIQMVSGNPADCRQNGWGDRDWDPATVADKAEQGVPVVLGSYGDEQPKGSPVVGGHAYVLLGRDADGLYVVKNPWGEDRPKSKTPGVLHLTAEQLKAYFVQANVGVNP